MHSSRFFNAGRSMFGSRLLEMSSNNIRRLCSSSNYHYSVKVHQTRLTTLNLIINSITNGNTDSLSSGQYELNSDMKDLSVTLSESNLELLRLQNLVAGQRNVLSTLRIGEPTKLNILSKDQKTRENKIGCCK